MKPVLIAFFSVLALPAGAGLGLSLSLPADATVTTQAYRCAGGAPFTVRYITAGPDALALVPVDGAERIFVNVLSGSGARYVSGPYVWWSKGDGATLEDEMSEGSLVSCEAAD